MTVNQRLHVLGCPIKPWPTLVSLLAPLMLFSLALLSISVICCFQSEKVLDYSLFTSWDCICELSMQDKESSHISLTFYSTLRISPFVSHNGTYAKILSVFKDYSTIFLTRLNVLCIMHVKEKFYTTSCGIRILSCCPSSSVCTTLILPIGFIFHFSLF